MVGALARKLGDRAQGSRRVADRPVQRRSPACAAPARGSEPPAGGLRGGSAGPVAARLPSGAASATGSAGSARSASAAASASAAGSGSGSARGSAGPRRRSRRGLGLGQRGGTSAAPGSGPRGPRAPRRARGLRRLPVSAASRPRRSGPVVRPRLGLGGLGRLGAGSRAALPRPRDLGAVAGAAAGAGSAALSPPRLVAVLPRLPFARLRRACFSTGSACTMMPRPWQCSQVSEKTSIRPLPTRLRVIWTRPERGHLGHLVLGPVPAQALEQAAHAPGRGCSPAPCR